MHGQRWLGARLLLGLLLLIGVAAGVWSHGAGASAQGGLPTRASVHTIATLHQGLRVYWYEPSEDGGSALTGYDVEYRSVGTGLWTDAGHTGTSQPALITGLRFNTSYEVRVRARNANGAGPWSSVETRRTTRDDGKPDRPWPPTLEPGDGRIEVSWTAPAYTGGRPITGYRVRYTTDDAATWRTWAPGGNRLITGTTTTITGLDNGVTVGVAVGALNARGQGLYSLPFSEAAPVPTLTLSLESSRALCTANTLTELSWTITGGVPPYELTIEGEKVDPSAESHRASCGPLMIDPNTEEPLPSQSNTFAAAVTDSREAMVTAEAEVMLAPPLEVPKSVSVATGKASAAFWWNPVKESGLITPDGKSWPYYLIRWRTSGSGAWQRSIHTVRRPQGLINPHVSGRREGLTAGARYEFGVAALRDPIEALTPGGLNWSKTLAFTTATDPQNVRVTATHDALTVTWDDQPAVREDEDLTYYVHVAGLRGGRTVRRYRPDEGKSPSVTIPTLDPDTLYSVRVYLPAVEDHREVEVEVRTLPAPDGWQALPRGPQSVRADATHDSITVRWNPPHAEASGIYVVYLFDALHPGDQVVSPVSIRDGRTYHTFTRLSASTSYRVVVSHRDIVSADAAATVRTRNQPRTASRAGVSGSQSLPDEGTLPPPDGMGIGQVPATMPVQFGWPLHFDEDYRMTTDMWVWRGWTFPAGFHHGLDVGHINGGGSIEGEPVYASASGLLRVFGDDPSERQTIWYCPDIPRPFHMQFVAAGEKQGSCGRAIFTASGRSAVVFHGNAGSGPYLTRYSHLQSIDGDIAEELGATPGSGERISSARTTTVDQGELIGYVGTSGASEESWDPHLHFEIRKFTGVASEDWYKSQVDQVACRSTDSENAVDWQDYCEWFPMRWMETVLDPEAHLPVLPASRWHTGPNLVRNERDKDVSDDLMVAYHQCPFYSETESRRQCRLFEIANVSVARATHSATDAELSLALSVGIWRPPFYTLHDSEFVASEPNGAPPYNMARTLRTGVSGTRAGVSRYRVRVEGLGRQACPQPTLSDTEGPANAEGEAARVKIVRDLRTGHGCKITVLTRNSQYQNGYVGTFPRSSGARRPPLPVAGLRVFGPLTGSGEILQRLADFDMHFYLFVVSGGTQIELEAKTGTIEDLVVQRWGLTGLLSGSDQVLRGTEHLSWTVPEGGEVYAVLIRGGYSGRSPAPSAGRYTLSYRVSCPNAQSGGARGQQVEGSAASAPQQCPAPSLAPPTNIMISMVTGTTAKLSWESGDTATTGYRLALDGTPLSPQPDLGGLTSHTFGGLSTATTEHVFSVVATGDLILESEPAALTLLLPPGSLGATATHDSITLSWNEVDRAERYELKRLAGDVACAGAGVQATVNDDGNVQTFRHTFSTGVEASKRYTLCARAANAQGPSAWAKTTVTTSAGRCPSPRPTKPEVNGFRPLGTATTWAEPSGGQTAEMTSEQRQPQTRTVTWNSAECRWDAGGWTDEGDPYWTPPAATGQSRAAPAKPSSSGYQSLGTATTWAEPSGGQTAELTSEQRQPQSRTVTWNSIECRWDAGGWADDGNAYWTLPVATGQTRTAPAKPSANGYRPLGTATTWAEPAGGQTAELTSEQRQPQSRTVTWNSVECRWDAGGWTDDGDAYSTLPVATGQTRTAPAKPSESQTIVVRSETRWAVPVGGQTAEEKRDLVQRQTRSVTWNTADCVWVTGAWGNDGSPSWTPWRGTGVKRGAPAKPSDSQTIVVRSETRWAVPVGGQTAEEKRDLIQRQGRSVSWDTAACAWVIGRWVDVGAPYWSPWRATGVSRTAPAKPPASQTIVVRSETRWALPVGGQTAEQQRNLVQGQARSVNWDTAACAWITGPWADVGSPSWTPWSATGTTRTAPAKPSATELRNPGTEARAQVRGTTAYKQSRRVATQHRRTVTWDGSDCSWDAGDWDSGVPWSTPWKDTGEKIERPPTRTWTNRVNEARTGRTRVIRVQTTPICLEQAQEQLRYRIRYSAQVYVWDGLMSWVLGPVTRTTPPVWHTRWRDVGGQRLCTLGAQEEETPAADADPTFGAGRHTLQWGAVWLRFTVPADASVLLAAQADAAGELTMVFSLASGAELVVSPSALARGERPTSADPTLASVAASLTLADEPEQDPAESNGPACATATPGSTTEPSRVDLKANDCTLISGGGTVALAADEERLSLTLPEGREWIAFSAPSPQDGAADAFWLVDAATGSLLALDPASGRELARQLTAGATDLGRLLDSIAGSAVAGG